MARGEIAKKYVVEKLKETFGQDWIGEYSKKYYIYAQENGERIQIAISLTCPKVQVAVADAPATGDFNFEDDAPSPVIAASGFEPAEITTEERERVNDLLKKLGL